MDSMYVFLIGLARRGWSGLKDLTKVMKHTDLERTTQAVGTEKTIYVLIYLGSSGWFEPSLSSNSLLDTMLRMLSWVLLPLRHSLESADHLSNQWVPFRQMKFGQDKDSFCMPECSGVLIPLCVSFFDRTEDLEFFSIRWGKSNTTFPSSPIIPIIRPRQGNRSSIIAILNRPRIHRLL